VSPVLDGGGPSGLPGPEGGLNTTQKIILNARQQLQDVIAGKWGDDVLLPYLDLAILAILNVKPAAYPSTVSITLVAGAKQALPSGAISLLDIICNLGVADALAAAITTVTKDAMDNLLPGWLSATAADTAIFAVTDPNEPKAFYVYPPQSGATAKVRALICTPPSALTASDSTFPLDDSYIEPAVDYLIYRCLHESTTIPNALSKAASSYQKFLQFFGIKTAVEEKAEEKSK
jgi:hypothetical protein